MELRKIFFAALCGVAVTTAFTSCDDDDESYNPYRYGQTALPQFRGYVLNEGSYALNNTSISYFDAASDTTTSIANDLYFIQNGKNLGDTGQDMIVGNNAVYVSVYGSSYIAKLNLGGVEEQRFTCDASIGQPRYLAEEDGYLYATTYGGYVLKLKASDLSFVDTLKVGPAPERILEKDGKLYLVCGNTMDYLEDHRLFIVDTNDFTQNGVKTVDVMSNPQTVVESGDYIFIQGYGNDWTNTPLWVYDTKTGKAEDTGLLATYIAPAANSGEVLAVFSMTDWDTWVTSNTFFTVNGANPAAKTDVTEQFVAAEPGLASCSLYSLSAGKDGSFYLMQSLYSAGDGTVYHFNAQYGLAGKFTSWGQNPKKVVLVSE